jgi:serine/threonine-protein kinase HipA
MNDTNSLNVWSEDRLVARLWRDKFNPQGMGLRYADDWVNNGGFAISQTLPLKTDEFPVQSGGGPQQFFANLLPESGARIRIVRDLKIPDTDFDLLRAIGGDCAGALSILPIDETPAAEQLYSPLSDEKLQNLVMRRGSSYVGISKDKLPRLSLAGAQDKCPVLMRGDQVLLPLREAPSSHILKFEIPDYKNVPAYETFTTMLARRVGLPAVDTRLCSLKKNNYVCIERYDRYEDEEAAIHRLHQEDFCQALGYGFQNKYEDDAGPTFAQCYQLVQEASTEPAIDLPNLLRWQVFNVLAGNSDGHAKNLSLLYGLGNEVRQAPFYDLVCTRAIERISENLAFRVGGEQNPQLIRLQHWEAEAKNCGIRPKFLLGLVQDLAQKLMASLAQTRTDFDEHYGPYPALQRVELVVKKQCARTLKEF